jgi:superfamily II DNA or RNA helicase/HKD family nuclease
MLATGLYEQVINRCIQEKLNQVDLTRYAIDTEGIDEAEAKIILSQYVSGIIEKALSGVGENSELPLNHQVLLCNELIDVVGHRLQSSCFNKYEIDARAVLLLALVDRKNTAMAVGAKPNFIRPASSIARSTLFNGARTEPSLLGELKKEISSADRVDLLVSFIKWSGLRLLMEELTELTRTRKLRIITTTYTGVTDAKAVVALAALPNTEIKISYDTHTTRLHAKAYIFYRHSGFTTAYVGSSNLSNAALSSGLEWNVKVTAQDLPNTIKQIEATFDVYWNDAEFISYSEADHPSLLQALKAEREPIDKGFAYFFEIRPYTFQKEILDKLAAERKIRGKTKNLIVAATGTGKTVIAALDYRRYREKNRGKNCRLLFVAHREEILKQSLACFRMVLKEQNFGELFVGGIEPSHLSDLFVSVQTVNARKLDENIEPDYYDFIVIDEFHHAAAPTYQRLLTHFTPQILLGLTATPERMDGQDILQYFDNRIAAEIRLPEAIERKLLCPFQYFGVSDSVDLTTLRWQAGGYDKTELSNVFTGNDRRAELVMRSTQKYLTDLETVRGLGFCASVAHAEYMADFFGRAGVPSMSLQANSPEQDRNDAKRRLVTGEIKFIFVVDLYNEGVDIPEINTVLFLRPTESLTVFLQQLGRGLRLFEGKECLTVLDFIGQAHKRYNFQQKFVALLINSERTQLKTEIQNGFLHAPRGCYIQLEKQAQGYILDNVKQAIGTRSWLIANLGSFESDSGQTLSLSNFLNYHHLSVYDIYAKFNFNRLCNWAGTRAAFFDPDEEKLTKALSRIAAINSRRWILYLLEYLSVEYNKKDSELEEIEKAMLRMMHYTLWQKPLPQCAFDTLRDSLDQLKRNPVMLSELIELLLYQLSIIDFVDEEVKVGFDCPLDLYCEYSRDQVLAGLGYYSEQRMPAMREGVLHLTEKNVDVLFITLNKADKDYSPSTMYEDYSISETLFHWQSQNITGEFSNTGKRYVENQRMGTRILLFVREYKTSKDRALPYAFLGLADYVSHTGSRPMNVIWRLHRPIPAKFYKKTNKLEVG